ncbi:uncharacterized protein F5891DRAFT_986375 [Suillus fuscotomentosus]|uniref:Uncharacterized protein n=1 Tax=Suillus fuscotomentosus TaxID=1912939 RepID=A0AAD4HET6_9AGAM|nr:uncharacterized protein F5891DRAFT_986375 [Suillus fuscotomentosus]KAG1892859.1 hypothetical protein F5891DRAFT_986375 [Suillus fuscotomentosus]
MGQLLRYQDHAHPNVNIKDPDSVPSINSALLDKISESQRAAVRPMVFSAFAWYFIVARRTQVISSHWLFFGSFAHPPSVLSISSVGSLLSFLAHTAAMLNNEQKDSERKKAEADLRKLDDVDIDDDIDDDSDKENISPYHAPKQLSPPHASTKRICREQTGTEWQSVLDVIKHGKEIQSKQNEAVIEEMKACTAVLE